MTMTDLWDGLMTTRAMRRFSTEPVDLADVEACLAAAVQAPSGGNIQPYQFLVVTDEATRAEIGRLYLEAHERYEPAVAKLIPPFKDEEARARHERNWRASDHLARTIGDVPVHVVCLAPMISMEVSDETGTLDVGSRYASVYPAVAWFLLACRARGLASVLTTVIRIRTDEVRALLGIPDRYEVAALLPVGHPLGTWGVAPRRPAASLTSWERFGERRPGAAGS